MMTINDYMNLKSISGTKIVSLNNIQRILMENYRNIQTKIHILRLENTKEYTRVFLEIPSETVNINYIVILDFYIDGDKGLNGGTHFKLFSNSPSLQFTFAYLYNKSDMLITDFKKYFNTKSFENKPEKRNPSMLIGFEKSVFYAILFIQAKYRAGFPKDNKGTIPKIIPVDSIIKLISKSKEKQGTIKKQTSFKF